MAKKIDKDEFILRLLKIVSECDQYTTVYTDISDIEQEYGKIWSHMTKKEQAAQLKLIREETKPLKRIANPRNCK